MNDILTNVPNNRSNFFVSAKSPITNCTFYVPIKEGATEAFAINQKEKLIQKLKEMDETYVFNNPMKPLLGNS